MILFLTQTIAHKFECHIHQDYHILLSHNVSDPPQYYHQYHEQEYHRWSHQTYIWDPEDLPVSWKVYPPESQHFQNQDCLNQFLIEHICNPLEL